MLRGLDFVQLLNFIQTALNEIQKDWAYGMRRIDLNLFRVFEAVLQHRSVSGASRELGVTASAVSHALSRLRMAMGDDLFVLGDTGMKPTARALELAPAIRDGLGRIEVAVSSKPFVPEQSQRTFRIASSDHTAVIVLPHVIGRLAKTAPEINFRIFPFNRLDVVRHLDDGRVDMVLGWFGDLPDRMRRATAMSASEAIVVRAGHPLTEGADHQGAPLRVSLSRRRTDRDRGRSRRRLCR